MQRLAKLYLPIIVVITALVWSSSISSEFNGYDDLELIVKNPNVQHGFLEAFKLYFFKTSVSFNLAWSDMPTTIYRPLEWLMSSIGYSVWGADAWSFHFFINFLIHIINSVLLYLILNRVLHSQANANWLAFVITLLWAVHPLHHESINMLTSGLGFLSSTLFMFLAIFLGLQAAILPRILSCLCFLISFFGVEMVLIGPALLTLVLLSQKKKLSASLGAWFALLGYFIFRFSFSNEVQYLKLDLNDFCERVFVLAPQVFLHHLKLFFYPVALTIDQHHRLDLHNAGTVYHFLSLLLFVSLLCLILYLLLNQSSRLDALIAGFGFFAILGIVMTLNIIPVYCLARDRYTYFFVLALVALFTLLCERFFQLSTRPRLNMLLLSALVLSWGYNSWLKNYDWCNGDSLWRQTIASIDDIGAQQIWRYSLIHYWEDSKTKPDDEILADFAYFIERNGLDRAQVYDALIAQAEAPENYLKQKYGFSYNKSIAAALYVLAERMMRFGFDDKSKQALLLSRKYYPDYFQTNMAIYLSDFYSNLDLALQVQIKRDLARLAASNKIWQEQWLEVK